MYNINEEFQFLMVRLKDDLFGIDVYYYKIFQFLMVRLKANWKNCITCEITISIPYGAIKRFLFRKTVHMLHYFNSLWCD